MSTARPRGDPVTLPPAKSPTHTTLTGRTVQLVPLSASHADDLFPLVNNDRPDQTAIWDYIPAKAASTDPLFFAVIDTRQDSTMKGKAVGYLSLMSIVTAHMRLEIGHVVFTKALQRTVGATEAIYLLLKHSIEDLGYRRIEWKCDSLNAPSRRAAERLGFTFEGIFRQHLVVKGRNRDTAWLSILREEWLGLKNLKGSLEGWLDEGNFDAEGKQLKKLEEFRSDV
ncbi:acyl-CoA N-acyltransferase [Aspergillus filifer]